MAPLITFLSDFGLKDSYVAEVKAVLHSSGAAPQVIDISHEIPVFQIEAGRFQLLRSYAHFPVGTFHLAVVDPGVGSGRRCVYVKTARFHFVGPDNGLLKWAIRDCERHENLPPEIYEIPEPVNTPATFHARDLMAPVIADLIAGRVPKLIPTSTLIGEDFPGSRELDGVHRGVVIARDHFGNVITSVPVSSQAAIVEGQYGDSEDRIPVKSSYQDIEEDKVGLIAGSHGYWEFAARESEAWEKLEAKLSMDVTLYPES